MSGYQSAESIVVTFHGNELSSGKLITFPKRVRINSMRFTIDTLLRGNPDDNRSFLLYSMVGHPEPTVENPFGDTSWNVFGDNPKPVISIPDGQSLVSTVGEVPTYTFENPQDVHSNIELTHGVLETGDFLWVVFDYSGAFPEDFDWQAASLVATITFEETTEKSIREMLVKYPFIP